MHAELLIQVRRYRGRAPDAPALARFTTDGGTLGPDPECTLRLLDADDDVDPVVARVVWLDSKFLLIGTNRPLQYNGDAMGAGHPITLRNGDELQLGDYVLSVEFLESQPAEPPPLLRDTCPVHR